MGETKINLNYQVKSDQFGDKVGEAIATGNASDEVEDKINSKFNSTPIGGGQYTGGHKHTGALYDGEKIDYNDLKNIPTVFPPETHTHSFSDLIDNISWTQISNLITTGPSDPNNNERLIRADDPRLSDARDPNPHTHPFTDITGDISFSQLDTLISTTAEANKLIEANDPRLSDSREPLPHDNTKHTEAYITSSGVTYEALLANGDIGTAADQVAQGDHNHNELYYTKTQTNSLLDGKADTTHYHTSGTVIETGLATNASFNNEITRAFSFPPFGFSSAWQIAVNGSATINLSTAGLDRKLYIPLQMIPDEAILEEMIIYVKANGPHNLEVNLMRTNMTTGAVETITSAQHNYSTTEIEPLYAEVTSTETDFVDKEIYSYWILIEEVGTSTDNVDITIYGGKIMCSIVRPLP